MSTIDAYLSTLPEDVRATLQQLRQTINAAAPEAVESISYGSPTFKYKGRPLIYFAAWKNHCAVYGIDVDAHKDKLTAYDASKGTIRFSHTNPLPESLVKTLVTARIAQIEAAATRKPKQS